MRWQTPLMVLLAILQGIFLAVSESLHDYENFMDDISSNEDEKNINGQSISTLNTYQLEQLDKAMRNLAKILILPWPNDISPLIYYEDNSIPVDVHDIPNKLSTVEYQDFSYTPGKRTRYYRKYPWKRQNSKYDPANRFVCNPSKEEVYRLLSALHEARQGNKERTVDFCNRKRPAYTVYTNIRFLGK